jgi:hypothetical protein
VTGWMIMRRYLGYWMFVCLSVSVISFVGPETFVPSRQPHRLPFFLGLALSLAFGVVMGFVVAYVFMLCGKFARRKIRDKEEAWETHVKRYIALPVGLPEAFKLAKRVLAQIGARILHEDKDGCRVSGQTGRRSGEKVCVRLAEEGGECTRATVVSIPGRDLLLRNEDDARRQPRRWKWLFGFDEDWGRNALNVQRICDGLVELAGRKGESGQ